MSFIVGLAPTKSTEAAREAAYALHAILSQAMGQCEEHQSRTEVVGDRKENRKRKKNLFVP